MATAKKESPTKKKTTAKASPARSAKATTRSASTKKAVSAKTKAAKAVPAKKATKTAWSSLRKLFAVGAALKAAAAVAVVILADAVSVPVTTTYLAENNLAEDQQLLSAVRELFQVNLVYVVAAILLAAAIWRLLLATRLYSTYQNQVAKQFTSLHWIEFSIAAPLVLGVLGLVVGIRDIAALLLLMSIPVGMAILGYVSDRYDMLSHTTWLKKKLSAEAALLPWIVIGIVMLHSYIYGFVSYGAGVYAVVGAGFALYLAVLSAHGAQITKRGRFADFAYGEKVIAGLHLLLLGVLVAVAFVA